MSEIQKNEVVTSAKDLSQWFEIDLTIRVLGVTIFSWHFPPKK